MGLLRLIIGLCCIFASVNAGSTSDGVALCDFYRALSVDSRGKLANWCAGSDPKNPCGSGVSSWTGVTCGTVGGAPYRVVKLDVRYKGLVGSIPSTVGNLLSLTSLDLNWVNGFTVSLPSTVDLYYNSLSGSLTSRLYNSLSGSLPSQLGLLTKLQTLSLGGNKFTGSLPSTVGNMLSLTALYLGSNSLTGSLPSQLGLLTNLQKLDLEANKFTGSLPSTVGNMLSLTALGLNSNKFTGSLPSTVGNLLSLTALYLGSNSLTGSLPSQLGLLTKLQVLWLNNNKFTSAVPASFCDLSKSINLRLDGNPGLTCLPSCLTNPPYGNLNKDSTCNTCTVAPTASPTFVPGTYDDGAALCTVYRALTAKSGLTRWCSGTGQYNPCLLSWVGVTCTNGRVTKLELGYTDLTGPLSSAIGNLGAITYISLRGNSLSGSLPSQLGLLKNLRELYLDDNQFTSAVPASFCDLSKSIDLQLNGNPGLTCLPSCLTSGSYQKLTKETAAVCSAPRPAPNARPPAPWPIARPAATPVTQACPAKWKASSSGNCLAPRGLKTCPKGWIKVSSATSDKGVTCRKVQPKPTPAPTPEPEMGYDDGNGDYGNDYH